MNRLLPTSRDTPVHSRKYVRAPAPIAKPATRRWPSGPGRRCASRTDRLRAHGSSGEGRPATRRPRMPHAPMCNGDRRETRPALAGERDPGRADDRSASRTGLVRTGFSKPCGSNDAATATSRAWLPGAPQRLAAAARGSPRPRKEPEGPFRRRPGQGTGDLLWSWARYGARLHVRSRNIRPGRTNGDRESQDAARATGTNSSGFKHRRRDRHLTILHAPLPHRSSVLSQFEF